ncbi:hypothetical protein LIA77_06423 [Sarocladium implicatum]|nr:hypothetical protein LIA77_06423 [Sarocladium implicatum]
MFDFLALNHPGSRSKVYNPVTGASCAGSSSITWLQQSMIAVIPDEPSLACVEYVVYPSGRQGICIPQEPSTSNHYNARRCSPASASKTDCFDECTRRADSKFSGFCLISADISFLTRLMISWTSLRRQRRLHSPGSSDLSCPLLYRLSSCGQMAMSLECALSLVTLSHTAKLNITSQQILDRAGCHHSVAGKGLVGPTTLGMAKATGWNTLAGPHCRFYCCLELDNQLPTFA